MQNPAGINNCKISQTTLRLRPLAAQVKESGTANDVRELSQRSHGRAMARDSTDVADAIET
jgi:hypothetical protein